MYNGSSVRYEFGFFCYCYGMVRHAMGFFVWSSRLVAGASEVRLPDRGGNPAAVACGDCLRMAVDILPSGKLGGEFLAGYAG